VSWNLELGLALAEHLLLTGAPAVAAALLAMRLGARNVPILLCIALATSGAAALLAFWAYYADPSVGRVWDWLALLTSIEVGIWSWYRGRLDPRILRELSMPLILWALGSFFVAYLGFIHGGVGAAIETAATRFAAQLPSDNDIPRFFAEWFSLHGHNGTPPVYPGGWLMSDRPPLQVGYVLSQRAFSHDTVNLHYQALCMIIQQLWVVGMWAVLTAARLRPATRSLAIFAAMVSDVAIVHGFFVWPKLLAAAFVLAAFALVVGPEWIERRRDLRVAALVAALCALALLAHGASAFAIIPLLVVAALRGMPGRWLALAAAVALALLLPWSAYQRYADPPGNRVVKWQIGGDPHIDGKGTLQAIVDGYSEAGLGGAIENKYDNFAEMVGWSRLRGGAEDAVDSIESGAGGDAVAALRVPRFFSLLPMIGVFLLAPFAMLAGRKHVGSQNPDWRFSILTLLLVAVGCVVWGLLMFGGSGATAMIHQGSLAIPLLAIVACVAGLRATYPSLATALVSVHVAIVLVLYVPSITPDAGTAVSPPAAVLAGLALTGFGLVAFRGGPRFT
jgi:hypothetical protein